MPEGLAKPAAVEPTALRRGHPSYSSIDLYRRCPAAWQKAYLENEPAVRPQGMDDGWMRHDLIARYARHCHARNKASDLTEGRRLALGYPPQVADSVVYWMQEWRWEWGVTKGQPVEQHLQATLPDGQTIFGGHPDLVQLYEGSGGEYDPFDASSEDVWEITDFKSRWTGGADEPMPMQLRWYAWLVQRNYPEAQSFRLRIVPICGGTSPKPWYLREDLLFVGEEIQSWCDRITQDEQFVPNLMSCDDCLYRLACPVRETRTWKAASADPRELMEAMVYNQGQADQAKAILHKRVKDTGESVVIPGYAYGPGKRPVSLVPRSPMTLETDLVQFRLNWRSLFGEVPTNERIEKATRELKDSQREGFLALFEEQEGTPAIKLTKTKPAPQPAPEAGEEGE